MVELTAILLLKLSSSEEKLHTEKVEKWIKKWQWSVLHIYLAPFALKFWCETLHCYLFIHLPEEVFCTTFFLCATQNDPYRMICEHSLVEPRISTVLDYISFVENHSDSSFLPIPWNKQSFMQEEKTLEKYVKTSNVWICLLN